MMILRIIFTVTFAAVLLLQLGDVHCTKRKKQWREPAIKGYQRLLRIWQGISSKNPTGSFKNQRRLPDPAQSFTIKTEGNLSQQFDRFTKDYGKVYTSPAEKLMRFETFKKNLELTKQYNSDEDDTAVYGITPLLDLTWEELSKSHHEQGSPTKSKQHGISGGSEKTLAAKNQAPSPVKTGRKAISPIKAPAMSDLSRGVADRGKPTKCVRQKGCVSSRHTYSPPASSAASASSSPPARRQYVPNPEPGPALLDWRKRYHLYPRVRDQNQFGYCGGCWAFSPVSALEIIYSRKYGARTHFSKQQLIDCCPNTDGCVEGDSIHALQYLVDVGVTLEDTYPFTGVKGECRSDFRIAARASRFTQIANDDTAIAEALRGSPLVVNLHCPAEIQGKLYIYKCPKSQRSKNQKFYAHDPVFMNRFMLTRQQ